VKNQLDRDKKVIELTAAMENAYSFVDEIRAIPDKIKTLDNIIKTILLQTFECSVFIQEYAVCGFLGKFLLIL